MLYGGYQHTVDKKGRVAIPSKLRDELGNSFMICQGIYGKRCLCVYSMDKWNELVEKINDFVHKENVKVYRNVQAVVVEENKKQTESLEAAQKKAAGKSGGILTVSIITLIAVLANIAWNVLLYLNIL